MTKENELVESELSDEIKCRSVQEFLKLVEDIKGFISRGLLRQIDGNCSIDEISEKKMWPHDVIQIVFETLPGGTRYLLGAETYHGSSSGWTKLAPGVTWKHEGTILSFSDGGTT